MWQVVLDGNPIRSGVDVVVIVVMCGFHTDDFNSRRHSGGIHSNTSNITRRIRAFTLIELLVVIGIVGVLATILFVSVGRSKLKGQAVVSQNNLRQLTAGYLTYELDAGEFMNHRITRQGKWVDELRNREGYGREVFQSPAALARRWVGPGNAKENWRVAGPDSTYEHITRI